MKYSSRQYAKALWELLEKKSPAHQGVILNNFMKLLRKQKEFKKLNFIVNELEKIHLTENNLLKAEIISPFPLSKTLTKQTKKFISSFFKRRLKAIILEQKIDKNLIGGFQIKVNDYLIDASVKNMLLKLKRNIRV